MNQLDLVRQHKAVLLGPHDTGLPGAEHQHRGLPPRGEPTPNDFCPGNAAATVAYNNLLLGLMQRPAQ